MNDAAAATRDGAGASPAASYALIPYVHVANLERSIAFYVLLGFELEDTHEAGGATVWASLRNVESRLFLILADSPIDAGAQAVLFYLWTLDVTALRRALMAEHVPVSAVSHPPYMPGGEVRLTDPDGYVLLIGQRPRA